ncbi:MAG TPA: tellurite resistance TerB C-terminal domain-containing protein [Coleofasciculaceae cyanobacterium]|jgi:chromosome segregation ATPase
MQSTKVVNQILLGSVAFSVSFGLGLLANRDLNKALLAGVITVPAAYAGVVIVDKRRLKQEKWARVSLLNQIQELEEEENQLYQSLYAATSTRQQIEASINALQSERSHLLNRVSDLHHQRNELYQEISISQNQKQQQEGQLYNLQTQVQQLERQQADLNLSISVKSVQIQQIETRIKLLRSEVEPLERQLVEKQNQQKQLNQDLATLEGKKQDLGGEVYDLQTHIQVLQQRQEELNQVLFPLQKQKQEVEVSLTPLQAKLKQLKNQVSEKQKQQERLNEALATLEIRKQQLEAQSQNLQTQIQALEDQKTSLAHPSIQRVDNVLPHLILIPEEWQEWLDFTQQLSEDEQRTLKAILEQDEAELKRIADQKSTMPQLLIDSINAKALETFGDTLFISGGGLTVPQVHEEYSPIFLEPLMVYFKDLLDQVEKTSSVAVRTK